MERSKVVKNKFLDFCNQTHGKQYNSNMLSIFAHKSTDDLRHTTEAEISRILTASVDMKIK